MASPPRKRDRPRAAACHRRCSDCGGGSANYDVVPVAVRNTADVCPHRPVHRDPLGVGAVVGGEALDRLVVGYAADIAPLALGVSSGGFGVYGGVHDEASTSQRQHHKNSQGDTKHQLCCFLLAAHPASDIYV